MTKLEEIAAAMSSGAEYEWDLTPDNRAYWLGMARAAVEAMREPSPNMRKAARDYERQYAAGEEWEVMCDAILNENPSITPASKPLPEGQGPEMTQEQISAFKATWAPFVDVLKGNAP